MIVSDAVVAYLEHLRPAPDPVLAEMEAHGARDGIPIVVPETGRLLELLALMRGARRIVEVGTAIGVSTLYMARALPPDGSIVSFDIDEARQRAARGYLERAGLAQRVELRLQDARAGLASLAGPFDMAFLDGPKAQYGDYLDEVLPLLGERAVLAVDNVLLSGTVAAGGGNGDWSSDRVTAIRAFNERVLALPDFRGAVLPVGDGVLVAVKT